jgi:hypothetical protein
VIAPAALSDSPSGSDPLASDHVYEPLPPVAVKVREYATPTLPSGSELVEIDTAGFAMLNVKGLVADPLAVSVARTVNCAFPAA